jgi:hypothetical protein
MEVPKVIFEDNYRAANAVRDHLDHLYPDGRPFTARPYQFQAPEFTDWYFFPGSGHWPAQRHGKLFIRRHPEEHDCLCAGYFVERGHGQQVLMADPGSDRKLIMQPDWYWFEFVRHAQVGELDAPVREVLQRSQVPLSIRADLWRYRPRDDDMRSRTPDDTIQFRIDSPEAGFQNVKKSEDIFARLNDSTNTQELTARLDGWDELDWYWVNLFIGVKLRYGDEETGTWRARDIWRNAMEPWADWVR